jgi:hypothetical protein
MDVDERWLERESLYKEVWAGPMTKVARAHGLSDRGLAKICVRMGVPVPGRGYWRRKETGHPVKQRELPPLKTGQVGKVLVRGAGMSGVPGSEDLYAFEKLKENLVVVLHPSSRLLPSVAKMREDLQLLDPDREGILAGEKEWCASIRVSEDTLDRTLLILDALFRAFEDRGYLLSLESKDPCVIVRGGRASFRIEEILKRQMPELTEAQKREKVREPWKYRYDKYPRVPSGRLRLTIGSPFFGGIGRRTWQDGKRQRVESCLNKFLAALAGAAAKQLQDHIEWERREAERKEQERRAEARRKRAAMEDRRTWALIAETEAWHHSRMIRDYVKALKRRAEQLSLSAAQDQEINDWVRWALLRARSLNPLALRAYCTREDRGRGRGLARPSEGKDDVLDLLWSRIRRRAPYPAAQSPWYRESWGDVTESPFWA